jgi:hypothetical protein
MGNYDFSFPCNFLIGMCNPAGPCLFVFRLCFQPKPGNIHTDNPDFCRRIELNCDQKFCIQSCNTDNKDRNYGYLDEPGRCTAQDRFRSGGDSCVHIRIARKRGVIPVHLQPDRDLCVPLYNSSLDERDHHRPELTFSPFLIPDFHSCAIGDFPGGSDSFFEVPVRIRQGRAGFPLYLPLGRRNE